MDEDELQAALQEVVDRFIRLDYAGTIDAANTILQTNPVPFVAHVALIALQRLGWKDQAEEFAAEAHHVFDEIPWEKMVIRLIEGQAHPGELLQTTEDPEQIVQVHFHAGSRALTLGDEAAAKAWLMTATKIGVDTVESRLAATELDLLDRYQGLSGRVRIFMRRAVAALDAGNPGETQFALDAAVQVRENVHGEFHAINGPLSFNYARALHARDDDETVATTIWAGIQAVRQAMGHTSYLYGLSLHIAKQFFESIGDKEQAAEAAENMGTFQTEGPEALDADVIRTAAYAYERGDIAEAADMVHWAFRMRDEPADGVRDAGVHLELARYLEAEDAWKEAITHLRKGLAIEQEREDASVPARRVDLMMDLVVALRKVGHAVDATTTLQRARAEAGVVEGKPDENACGFLFALGDRHVEADLPRPALAYYEECLAATESVFGKEDTEVVGVLAEVGRLRMVAERHEAARAALERALEIATRNRLDRHPQWTDTLERVRDLLDELDELDAHQPGSNGDLLGV